MALSPMMRQYLEIKEQYKDALVFYRLGDFYEMFFDDAKTASRELELTLTGRACGEEERAPMCGVPFHSVDTYIGRLVNKGYKVVICEQMEDPALAKGIVKRDVVRIVTPGTVIDNAMLSESQNNYLCTVCYQDNSAGVTFADISTGDISVTYITGNHCIQRLTNEIGTFSPREIIFNTDRKLFAPIVSLATERSHTVINDLRSDLFDMEGAQTLISSQFKKQLSEFDLTQELQIASVAAMLRYIKETQKTDSSYIKTLSVYSEEQYLDIDLNTRRNLELCETMRNREKRGTLLWVLDRTKTAMGARLLRKWVELPLVNTFYICRRQNAVKELFDDFMLREELSQLLKGVLDIERLMTKIVYGTANARDLRAVCSALSAVPKIKALIGNCTSDGISEARDQMDELTDICSLIDSAISEEPPFSLREGGLIKPGFSPDIDELVSIMNGSQSYLESIEAREREETGIKNLRISYNKVFGYYIEVTKSMISLVPDRYIRKQTLTNCERYITEELKVEETKILGASEKVISLEYELFQQIRLKVAENAARIQSTASALALIDVYVSLADVAVRNNYVCPEVDYGDTVSIVDGRHPVVEQFVSGGYFVPNNTQLDTNHNRLMIITGPNMSGKSTYMRQTAVICVMAQIGSFVPAKEARIGIIDKLFTRVGASDDLASGQSTFMLEMNEVAYILKNATKRSLIIYDEIGRGTSTFDGMSIARAVAEYTASSKLGAKTLFATHYHELTDMEGALPGVVNYSIAAKKRGDDIIFLRKIVKGAADDSYGIEVAKLAGIPSEIIKNAKKELHRLEENSARVIKADEVYEESDDIENVTIDNLITDEIVRKIRNADIELMTPIEAMNFLYELKKDAE